MSLHFKIRVVMLFLMAVATFNAYALKFAQPVIDDGFANRPVWSIDQDLNGYMWFATSYNVLRYDGYQFFEIPIVEDKPFKKRTLHVDHENRVWIGTELGEIYIYEQGYITSLDVTKPFGIAFSEDQPLQINAITSDPKGRVYMATNHGIVVQAKSGDLSFIQGTEGLNVSTLLITHQQELLWAHNHQIFKSPLNGPIESVLLLALQESERIRILFEADAQQFFVGSSKNLYRFDTDGNDLTEMMPGRTEYVLSIVAGEDVLWVGTLLNGLYKLNLESGKAVNYKPISGNQQSISDNIIISLYLDQSGVLFAGTFYGNLNVTNTQTLKFGALDKNAIACLDSEVVYSIYDDPKDGLWLSTLVGLVNYSQYGNICKIYKSGDDTTSLSYSEIRSIYKEQNNYWISTNRGLNLLDLRTSAVDQLKGKVPQKQTIFSVNLNDDVLLIGTETGLYEFDKKTQTSEPFPSTDETLTNAEFITHQKTSNGTLFFATSVGVAIIEDNVLKLIDQMPPIIAESDLTDMHYDVSQEILWLSSLDNGLFAVREFKELIQHYAIGDTLPENAQLVGVVQDNAGDIWVSSFNGLYRIQPTEKSVHVFRKSDGLQGNTFKRGAIYKDKDGKLFFGGNDGLNTFYPHDIVLNENPPEIALTDFLLFNKPARVGKPQDNAQFILQKPINALESMELTHKDYIFGIEFAALDFADSSRNKYAYRLKGLNDDWVNVDSDDRKATFTNLKPGDYTFEVKAANKDGFWNESSKKIAIVVKPAPWFSWWAYLSYAVMLMLSIVFYINKKTKDSIKQARLLKVEVERKTQELKVQKQRVEGLLARKNELFSNVSHEFRTPLTLILGPIKELISQGHNAEGIQSLNVINRNANRLLSLVEQLLQLARVSDSEKVNKTTQHTETQIQSVVDSFQHMAVGKKIKLSLSTNENAKIYVTDQCVDAILGNLISNAIKYTQVGGQVDVKATVNDDTFFLEVRDTGAGLSEEQQKDIFKRFKRLDSHQEIEGIGIGLSVVEEVVKINQGRIEVISELGVGSQFIVRLPLSDSIVINEVSSNNSLVTQLAAESPETEAILDISDTNSNNQLNQVLVIEDNKDMRNYIVSIVNPHYSTLTAENGKVGVAMAIEHIPDLIICDVMMPEMDGFKVSRIIRSDKRTSHIPLILLTALNDTVNRIKGWREHVDAYMTKPFDRNELLIQLENMLTIRDILKKKAGQNIFISNDAQTKGQITMPKKDQQFIDKVMELIKQNYSNPELTLTTLASDMAVSERQLQRKLKALIDQNPVDLVREFRLKKASELLKDGYQVSQIADNCGFNSVSYFSACFKAHYGMPPKKYQKTTSNNN
ncbi:ATP-binding protein [Marinicella sp. W31]|uniref:hybrid sensor histidine kinase/response regulator transcription factor n=1 Tax=Marinicella sp. W31 TaxID=3023713 RepID=UPI00375673F8